MCDHISVEIFSFKKERLTLCIFGAGQRSPIGLSSPMVNVIACRQPCLVLAKEVRQVDF